jgi:multiple sugar transport system substrate-binding protein
VSEAPCEPKGTPLFWTEERWSEERATERRGKNRGPERPEASRTILRGLTWDHPRGYVVLDALAADEAGTGGVGADGVVAGGPASNGVGAPNPIRSGAGFPNPSTAAVRWDRQPLEGFESRPLRTLADEYDLVVIDHPGLGEAVGDGALLPLELLLSDAELAACAEVSAGRSFASYRLNGQQWALPIDAAAQVSVGLADGGHGNHRTDDGAGHVGLTDEQPVTWDDACRVARRQHTAVCLGGPHALLMFSAICVALGAPPDDSSVSDSHEPEAHEPEVRHQGAFVDPGIGSAAVEIMAELLAHADQALAVRNPIAVLDAMTTDDGPDYCPLVYGYVTYQRPRPGRRALAAFDAPAGPGGIGSVLGGTGLAVTRSCASLAAARSLLLRLVSRDVQVDLYAELGGQSADRRAWLDQTADARAGGFYAATRPTIEAAWVRPRFPGYVEFQAAASAVLRDGLIHGERPRSLVDRVNGLFVREAPRGPR